MEANKGTQIDGAQICSIPYVLKVPFSFVLDPLFILSTNS